MQRTLAGCPVNSIGLGCMNVAQAYDSPPPRADAVRLFRQAHDMGCDHFDTANI